MKLLRSVAFAIGILLLSLNIIGLFKTLRNPAIYNEENTLKNRIGDVTIPYPEIKDSLIRQKNESDEAFAIRINRVVNKGFAHYWKEAGIKKYYLQIPAWENYLLFAASYVDPEDYMRYEFTSYKKGLERGVGVCSGHSIVVKGVLNDNGIPASLWDIAGHVVVNARVEKDKSIVLDPDFGIVVPYDTTAINANPEIVRPYYANMAALYYPEAIEPYTTDHVVEIYGKEGNHTYTVDNWFEGFSYIAIWIIPFLLMAPLLFFFFRKKATTND
ncbi:MAG: hypothetical protein ABI687_12260 [Flavitalea sp.]